MLVWLNEIDPSRLGDFGSKAANIGRLIRSGFPVPGGFCIPAPYYLEHMKWDSIAGKINGLLGDFESIGADELERLRQEIATAPLSAELFQQIEDALGRLKSDRVAVRSSATVEDLPGHSFAGLYDTFLAVQGTANIIQAVKSCWASLWSHRAFEYRQRKGFGHRSAQMAVIVQALVPADASGVLFTSDPRGGNSDRLIIEGSFGLGEALVSGMVTPDRIVLSKADFQIVESVVSEKKLQIVAAAESGVRSEALGEGANHKPCLAAALIHELAELGLKAEREFGAPQDIEWAVSAGNVAILQSRPITTLARKKSFEDRQVWSNLNAGEVLPDVVSPMTWSVVERLVYQIFNLILGRLGMEFGRHPLLGQIAGRGYFNLNTFTGMMRKIPGLGSLDPTEMFGGRQGDAGALALAPEDIPDLNFRWGRFFLRLPGFLVWFLSHTTYRGLQFAAALRRNTERLERSDLNSLPDSALIGQLHALLEDPSVAMRAISYGGIGAMYLSPAFAVCRRWLGDTDGSLANRLLGGLGHMDSAESGLDLWRLAAFAHQHPEVERTILTTATFESISAALPSLAGGPEFSDSWREFMREHGHHTRAEIELLNQRWRETPDAVLDMVRGYLRGIDAINPVALHEERRKERRQLNAISLAKLRNPLKRWLFQLFVEGAQRGCLVRENVKSEAVRRFAHGRSVLLELGKRWQKRGMLVDAEDVLFLRFEELRPVSSGRAPFDVRQAIADRRAEFEKHKKITPPAVVVGKFDPERYVADGFDSSVRILTGLGVSSGVATGRARVVLRSDTTEQVQPGEILVAPFTDPGWTPYFLHAAAIVMDLGGLLSHGSIIAREYGIPAVANVGPATRIIRTGQRLHVDGNRGEVRILE
jgi:pyruvate,water dikinase